MKDPTFHNYKGIDELFPVDSTVFTLGHPNYGCKGKVSIPMYMFICVCICIIYFTICLIPSMPCNVGIMPIASHNSISSLLHEDNIFHYDVWAKLFTTVLHLL